MCPPDSAERQARWAWRSARWYDVPRDGWNCVRVTPEPAPDRGQPSQAPRAGWRSRSRPAPPRCLSLLDGEPHPQGTTACWCREPVRWAADHGCSCSQPVRPGLVAKPPSVTRKSTSCHQFSMTGVIGTDRGRCRCAGRSAIMDEGSRSTSGSGGAEHRLPVRHIAGLRVHRRPQSRAVAPHGTVSA